MNNHYLKVKGYENLYRDSSTGAIVNTDKPASKNFSKQFSNTLNDINTLKEEMSEIKKLLEEIVEKWH